MKSRAGFTVIELLLVAILGSVLVLTSYQLLITNRRAFTVQNTKMVTQQVTRGTMDVLFSELRELSPSGGDLIRMTPDEFEFRTMRTYGVTCGVNLSGATPQLTVLRYNDFFSDGDSVFVFADNDDAKVSDDRWVSGRITGLDTTTTCPNGAPAQVMSFSGQMGAFTADSVRVGALVRSYEQYTYGLTTYDGKVYLGRREAGGDWVPLMGPLRDADTGAAGLSFVYRDADGNTTNVGTDVQRIDVTVRTWTEVLDRSGNRVLDTLTASVYTRN